MKQESCSLFFCRVAATLWMNAAGMQCKESDAKYFGRRDYCTDTTKPRTLDSIGQGLVMREFCQAQGENQKITGLQFESLKGSMTLLFWRLECIRYC